MVAGALAPVASGHAAVGDLPGSFRGDAYGTFANKTAGQLATTLGRSAYIGPACRGNDGATRTNSVDDVNAGRAFSAEQLFTTAYSDKTATSAVVKDTARVSGLSTLNGQVRATAVYAVAQTSANTRTISSSPAGSTFENLMIAGQPVASNVAPNTRVNIPGFGYAILKQISRQGDGVNSSLISVNMININITQANSLNIPVGARIIVSHAKSGYVRGEPTTIVSGQAFATFARSSADTVKNRLGRSAAIYMGCIGTNGNVRSNNVKSLSLPGVFTGGTGTTTVYGARIGGAAVARVTSTVQNVNLLGGQITASGVKAISRTAFSATGNTTSTQGSEFTNLSVLGVAVPSASVTPNTRVELPGIGYAILYEVKTVNEPVRARTLVNMIHLFVTDGANTLGLPAGTEIIVASADSAAADADAVPGGQPMALGK